jgi:uncharacterized protein YjbI with pentapeptide repeats
MSRSPSRSRPVPKAPRAPSPDAATELPYDELEDLESYTNLALADQTFGSCDGVGFKQVSLQRIDWRAAFVRRLDLTDVTLAGCDLSNTRWEGAGGDRVAFEACRLTGFAMPGSRLKEASFKDCQARIAQFENTGLKGARFVSCSFVEANFNGADLTGAVFVGCDLHHATFTGANLNGADFRGSNLEASRVGLPELKGAVISPGQGLALLERFAGVIHQAEDEG